jgi:hypothetical protein
MLPLIDCDNRPVVVEDHEASRRSALIEGANEVGHLDP